MLTFPRHQGISERSGSLIEKIKGLMRSSKGTILTNEQKNAIDQAFESIHQKGTTSHNTVIEETKKRFPHLYNR